MLNGKGKKQVLYTIFKSDDGYLAEIFIEKDEISERMINKKFDCCGISFGYGREKESQVRRQLIAALMQCSCDVEVPLHHGWNQMGKKWHFVFPDEITWKEIEKNV